MSVITELVVAGVMVGVVTVAYKYFKGEVTYRKYMAAYKLGRLIEHADSKGIDFYFPDDVVNTSELESIDRGFDELEAQTEEDEEEEEEERPEETTEAEKE